MGIPNSDTTGAGDIGGISHVGWRIRGYNQGNGSRLLFDVREQYAAFDLHLDGGSRCDLAWAGGGVRESKFDAPV